MSVDASIETARRFEQGSYPNWVENKGDFWTAISKIKKHDNHKGTAAILVSGVIKHVATECKGKLPQHISRAIELVQKSSETKKEKIKLYKLIDSSIPDTPEYLNCKRKKAHLKTRIKVLQNEILRDGLGA